MGANSRLGAYSNKYGIIIISFFVWLYYYLYYYCCCYCLRLIIGASCFPTVHFKFIRKCDKCYYHKLRPREDKPLFVRSWCATAYFSRKCYSSLLQSAAAFLLWRAITFITNCDHQFYYKVQQVLQSETIITKCATEQALSLSITLTNCDIKTPMLGE